MLRKFLVALFAFLPTALFAIDVKVGAYDFPPYVTDQGGVTKSFVQVLNDQQSQYKFTLVPTTAENRYQDMKAKKIDLILFEDIAWGWSSSAVKASTPYLQDAAVYVALKKEGRGQAFFDTLKKRSLLVRRGYHYGFADFNADEKWLKKHFRIQLYETPKLVLDNLLAGKGEIAVITKSFLNTYLQEKPEAKDKFLVSEKLDQAYHLSAVIGSHAPLSVGDFDKLIESLKSAGKLDFSAILL